MKGLYINLAELQILMDAAIGSLKIHDNVNVWSFGSNQRPATVNALLERMGQEKLAIGDGGEEEMKVTIDINEEMIHKLNDHLEAVDVYEKAGFADPHSTDEILRMIQKALLEEE